MHLKKGPQLKTRLLPPEDDSQARDDHEISEIPAKLTGMNVAPQWRQVRQWTRCVSGPGAASSAVNSDTSKDLNQRHLMNTHKLQAEVRPRGCAIWPGHRWISATGRTLSTSEALCVAAQAANASWLRVKACLTHFSV